MSGHSKWSKVKHQKATTDVVKAKAFTHASRLITVAVHEGGGVANPDDNFRLRLAIETARAANMPKENIERAIEKARGGGMGQLERIIYEGYGPGGVAMLVEVATDNRNRSAALIKNIFEHSGGSFAGIGAVSFLFSQVGVVTVPTLRSNYDRVVELAIAAGADDVIARDDVFELYTAPARLHAVKQALVQSGLTIDNADIVMQPISTITIDVAIAEQLGQLVEHLETADDVLAVYTNAV